MLTTRASGDVSCVCSARGGCRRLHVLLPLVLVASVSPNAAAASSLTRNYVAPEARNKQRLPAANQSPAVRGSSVAGTGVPPQESAGEVLQIAVSKRRRRPLDRNPNSRRWISRSALQSNAKARVLAVAAALVAAVVAVAIRIRCSRYYIEKGGGWGSSLRWRRLSGGHDDREPLCYWEVGNEDGDGGQLAEEGYAGPADAGGENAPAGRLEPLLLDDAQRNGSQEGTSIGGPTARLLVWVALTLLIYIIYGSMAQYEHSAGNSTATTSPASTRTASTGRTTSAAFTSVEATEADQSTLHTTNVGTTDGEASNLPTSSNTPE